jgi:cytoplasmic tRNA 2-thiolation protein 1
VVCWSYASIRLNKVHSSDSTVLAYVMKALNDRYDYGIDLYLLSIDEGITGYRDASLDVCIAHITLFQVLTPFRSSTQTVKQNADEYQLPLLILPYSDLYGWTMDRVVGTIGKKNNCTYCGVFR